MSRYSDEGRYLRNLGPGLGEWLALFAGEQDGEIFSTQLDEVEPSTQDGGPRRRGPGLPGSIAAAALSLTQSFRARHERHGADALTVGGIDDVRVWPSSAPIRPPPMYARLRSSRC